jgi:hypothetical protein
MMRFLRDLFRGEPDEDEEHFIERIAQRVVREGLGAAFIVLLESGKPISFITGQAALAATPFIGGFLDPARIERYSDLFSNRDFVERLISRIEALEADRAGEAPAKAKSHDTDAQ